MRRNGKSTVLYPYPTFTAGRSNNEFLCRCVARIFRGGVGYIWAVKIQTVVGGSGGMLPRENFRNLECLGLHFTRFDGGQREK